MIQGGVLTGNPFAYMPSATSIITPSSTSLSTASSLESSSSSNIVGGAQSTKMSEQEMYAYSQLSNQSNSQTYYTPPPAPYSSLANDPTNNQSSSILEGVHLPTGENIARSIGSSVPVGAGIVTGTLIGRTIGRTFGPIGAGVGGYIGNLLFSEPAAQIGANIYNNYLKEPVNDFIELQTDIATKSMEPYTKCVQEFGAYSWKCRGIDPISNFERPDLRRMK